MAAIVGWWAIPLVTLVVIVAWTAWRGRPRKPLGMHGTVAHYEQFQALLTRVVNADPTAADDRRDPKAAEPRAAADRDVP